MKEIEIVKMIDALIESAVDKGAEMEQTGASNVCSIVDSERSKVITEVASLRSEVERLREGLLKTVEEIDDEMADWACIEYPYLCADMIPLYNIRSVATAALNSVQNGNSSVGDMTNGVGEREATDV